MKKIVLLLTVIIFFVSCKSVEKYNTQITGLHSVESVHEDIDIVYKKLQKLHPRLYLFYDKEILDYKFDSLKNTIVTPITSRDFYKKLAGVTKYVGQGHMSVVSPEIKYKKKERIKLEKMRFDLDYLDLELLDNKLFITNAIGKDTVLINAEILKVEDETPQDLIKKYKKIIASDGYNTTFYNRIIGKRFFRYYRHDKGRYDSIALTLKNTDSVFIKRYKRFMPETNALDSINKSQIKLTKAERKAKKQKAKALYKFNNKYGFVSTKHKPDVKLYNRNLNFIGKDSTVALVKIRSFQKGNYKAFYDEVFETLDSLNTKSLVIDLRNNLGGRLDEISYLYSYLTDKKFTFINKSEINKRFPLLRFVTNKTNSFGFKALATVVSPVIATIDVLKTSKKDGQLYYKTGSSKEQDPKALNFKGKVYVLINGNSFSASSVLSTQLKGSKRATFVGEETGGAYNGTVAGMFKMYELPNTKVVARIGLMFIDSKYKTEVKGFGVKPDVKITPTYQDRLDNKDPELEWVLNDIEK